MNDYHYHLLVMIGIYLIFAQSFNLTFGLGKAFNLAHVASYALGAYASALLSTELNSGFFSCLVFSTLFSGLFAFLIGAIAIKLANDYFAIGTLAFSFLVTALLINWKSLTRGVLGITGIPAPELVMIPVDFAETENFMYLTLVVALAVQALLYLIFLSPYARSLRAQGEFPQGAMALGMNTRILRNFAFFLASALAGLAGSLFAFYIRYIDPSSFSLSEMIFVLTIVVLGRPGSFWGTAAATVFLVLLPEPLREVDIPSSILGPVRQMLYALALFMVVYLNRARLWPAERRV